MQGPVNARISVAAAALLAALLCAAPRSLFAQGETGYLRGKGRTDVAVSYSEDTYDKFWMGHRRVADPGVKRITRAAYNLFVAHGVTDDIDLSFSAPYVRVDSTGVFRTVDDFTDLEIRLKWRVFRKTVGGGSASFLLAPGYKVPIDNYENNAPNALSDEQEDFRARGIVHFQSDSGVFLSLDTGYDFRAARPHDEFPVHVKAGFTLFQRVTLSSFYSRVNSLGGYDIGDGPFPGVEEDYERWGVGTYIRITDRFGITGSYYTTLAGQNTGDVDGFAGGIVIRL
ncbi:MAG: hypothetical protein L0Z55_05950 [Planctomycetes bacterium]|nr:hypothetical protein [Planctomycetota bacterium]